MRRFVFGFATALSTFSIGTGLSLSVEKATSHSTMQTVQDSNDCGFDINLPVSSLVLCNRILDACPLIERTIVVSIASDTEFYLGKDRITAGEIPAKVGLLQSANRLEEKVAYIKAAGSVRFGTLALIKEKLHEAGVIRIVIVKNKSREIKEDKSRQRNPKS